MALCMEERLNSEAPQPHPAYTTQASSPGRWPGSLPPSTRLRTGPHPFAVRALNVSSLRSSYQAELMEDMGRQLGKGSPHPASLEGDRDEEWPHPTLERWPGCPSWRTTCEKGCITGATVERPGKAFFLHWHPRDLLHPPLVASNRRI